MHKNPANEPNRQQKVAKICKNYKNMRKKAPKLNLFRKLFQYGIIIVQKKPWEILFDLKSVPAHPSPNRPELGRQSQKLVGLS